MNGFNQPVLFWWFGLRLLRGSRANAGSNQPKPPVHNWLIMVMPHILTSITTLQISPTHKQGNVEQQNNQLIAPPKLKLRNISHYVCFQPQLSPINPLQLTQLDSCKWLNSFCLQKNIVNVSKRRHTDVNGGFLKSWIPKSPLVSNVSICFNIYQAVVVHDLDDLGYPPPPIFGGNLSSTDLIVTPLRRPGLAGVRPAVVGPRTSGFQSMGVTPVIIHSC